jgi:hypothetical protein
MRRFGRDCYAEVSESRLEQGVKAGLFKLPVSSNIAGLPFFDACSWTYHWVHTNGPIAAEELAKTPVRDAWSSVRV